jgi:superfamily II DNA or RNA helicase
MDLRDAVEVLISRVLSEFSYHPFFAPFLDVSGNDPLEHFIHQYEVIGRLAVRCPVRVLIGDEIGLGKTITAIGVSRYLEKLGRVKKVLIVVPRVLVGQWRKELLRMGIPSARVIHLDSNNLEYWKGRGFPDGYYIISMDLLKRRERINVVSNVSWDLIVVDEVHKFGSTTKRFSNIGKLLIEGFPNRNVLFLSATPHKGDPQDYLARLQLLDPFLDKNFSELDSRLFYELTHGAILFRRTKEDVNKVYEGRNVFPSAKFFACVIATRDDEAEFIKDLVEFLRSKLEEFAYEKELINEKVIPLLTVIVFKRASSSPYAAMRTLERLLIKRASPSFSDELIDSIESFFGEGYEDYESDNDPEEIFDKFLDETSALLSDRDREEVNKLRNMARSIMEKGDSKLKALISLLENIMNEKESKVIIFTEYKDTLDYIYKGLEKAHPEWASNILRLTSDETRDEEKFQRIKRRFETDSNARILLATDVVAEGVNLQVAHILINYEIPWSLVKVEQRIGRVWRLGQKRNVEAYTLFMNSIADKSALQSIYEKLINLKKAQLSPKPVTGQEVLFYAETEDLSRIPPPIRIQTEGEKKKFARVTEYTAIKTFLSEGKTGLDRLVESIIMARQEMEKELSAKGVLYKPKTKEDVEKTLKLLGFKGPSEVFQSLSKLVKSSSHIFNFKVSEENSVLKVITGYEMPKTLRVINDFYGLLVKETSSTKPVNLAAYGDKPCTIILLPVEVKNRRSGITVYREVIGVDNERKEILRGSQLFEILSRALTNCIGVSEDSNTKNLPISLQADVKDNIRRSISSILEPIQSYIDRLGDQRLRDKDNVWSRISDLDIVIGNTLGSLHFLKEPTIPYDEIPKEEKDEIEKKAMEFVMKTEKEEGRIPINVSEREHYDILSQDPAKGEIRIIEVKGHKGNEIYGELSEGEAKVARKECEKYWLYIVYDIGTGNPKLLRFKDPVKTMIWTEVEKIEKKRKFILRPREQVNEPST